MKKIAFVLLILLAGGITNRTFAQKKGRAVVCFKSDMDCADCEKTLYEHLKFEKGVKDLKIDHASNTIYIEYTEKKNDENGLKKAIEEKEYKAEKIDKKAYEKLLLNVKEKGHMHQQEIHKERS